METPKGQRWAPRYQEYINTLQLQQEIPIAPGPDCKDGATNLVDGVTSVISAYTMLVICP